MTNENIQGPVQLTGKGFYRRSSNNYEPGEYHDLQNLVITDEGTLRQRPPIMCLKHDPGTFMNNILGYSSIGYGGVFSVYSSYTITGSAPNVYRATDTANTAMTVNYANLQTQLNASATPGATRRRLQFEGIFDYNQETYGIAWYAGQNGSGVYDGYLIVFKNNTAFSLFQGLGVADPTKVSAPVFHIQEGGLENPTHYNTGNPAFPTKPLKDWLIHKERLWLASNDTVYFSKATDPLNFTVPEGGFFRFSDKQIKSLVAWGDTVYVIFDESISAITYQVDPNVDSVVNVISGVVGGDGACLYGDTVYVVKNESIYQINGNNIDKVMELSLGLREQYSEKILNTSDADGLPLISGKTFEYKVVGWNDALYILPRHIVLCPNSLGGYNSRYDYQYSNSDIANNSGGLFRVSLTNGSVSRFLFASGNNEIPSDMMYMGPEDRFNQSKLMLLFYHPIACRIGFLGSSPKFWYDIGVAGPGELATTGFDKDVRFFYLDVYNTSANNLGVLPIRTFMRIMNFSPDGMHWLMKKFRSIVINGDFPRFYAGVAGLIDYTRLKVAVGAYSDDSVLAQNVIIDELITEYTPLPALASKIASVEPRSYRYGTNQRSKNITILIYTDGSLIGLPRPLSDYQISQDDRIAKLHESNMEITDIRTLWSYIGRGPTNDPNDVS